MRCRKADFTHHFHSSLGERTIAKGDMIIDTITAPQRKAYALKI
jgi:hypothetical protein